MPEPYDLDKLQAYVEGDMTPDERDAYERDALAQDPGLRDLVADLMADRDALRRLPDEPPERALMPAATERAERSMLLGDPEEVPSLRMAGGAADRRHVWTRRLVYSGVAAAVLLAAGAAFYSLQEMGVDNLEQWEQQPLASNADRAPEEPQTTQRLPLAEGESEGEAEGEGETVGEAPSLEQADRSPLALGDREMDDTGQSLRGRSQANARAEPQRGGSSMAEAASEAATPQGVARARERKTEESPTLLSRETAVEVLAEARRTPADDTPAGDAASVPTPESQTQTLGEALAAVRSAAEPKRPLAAASEDGLQMRFRSKDPRQARQQMLAAARDRGLPVLDADEAIPDDAGKQRSASRESDDTSGLQDDRTVETFDQRVSTLQMVVLAPPEQVANELRQFEGELIGEPGFDDREPRAFRETPDTPDTPHTPDTPDTPDTPEPPVSPALSTPSELPTAPAITQAPAADAESVTRAAKHGAAALRTDAPGANDDDAADEATTTVDYAAILLSSLPIDRAEPIDPVHPRQRRVTIFFVPTAPEPANGEASENPVADEPGATETSEPAATEPSE